MTDRLGDVIRQLRAGDAADPALPKGAEITVVNATDHPNSRITRLRATWRAGSRTLVVKQLRPDEIDGRANRGDRDFKTRQIQTEYRILMRLHKAFAGRADLGVVTPVACFPDELTLVTEEANGPSLAQLWRDLKVYSAYRRQRSVTHWTYLAGEWLRLFQEWTPASAGDTYDPGEVRDYNEVRLHILAEHDPASFSRTFCDRLRQTTRGLIELAGTGHCRLAGRHNDYGPNNMIIAGRRLTVLDFAGYSVGPVVCDYVKFWSMVEQLGGSPLIPGTTVKGLKDAFGRGYGQALNPDELPVALFRLAHVLDKMGDICLDWNRIPWSRRPVYARLYRRYHRWLTDLAGRILGNGKA